MIAIEVYELLGEICSSHGAYYSVMDCDSLPRVNVPKYPMALVVNTSPAPREGHWVGMYMQDELGPIEFFDTFNLPPSGYNDHFVPFIRRMSNQLITMPRAIQCVDSNYCGHHCLHYMHSRMKRMTIENIYTNIFQPGCRNNDLRSKIFVRKLKDANAV